jgi:methyl-accepting chemotaxis protein
MFKHLKLKHQLWAGFGVVIALFLVAQAVVGVYLRQVIADVRQINQETLPFAILVGEMDTAREAVQQFLTDVSATHDDGGYKEADEAAQKFLAGVEKYKAMYRAEGDRASLAQMDALEADFRAFHALGIKMARAYVTEGMDAGNLLMKGTDQQPGFDAASEKLSNRLDAFRTQQVKEADELTWRTLEHTRFMGWLMLAGVGLAAVAGVAVGGGMAMLIMRELGGEPLEAARLAREVGAGNLTVKVDLRPDDQDSLMAQLVGMRDSLTRVALRIRGTSDTVATAATQIASGNGDLAQRTSQQAAALEEAAATMEQMSTAVENNAQNGQQAKALARTASSVAERGGQVVQEVVSTMAGIHDASRRIADIIGVIDGIAFQTNILALNAAVEAARAGEQGRGFAVVAGEVRNLAQRSAQAAKEIKDLITASVTQVESGSRLVNQAGSTMAEVVASIRRVTELVDDISVASHEQAQGVAQVGQTVSHLDHDTQQNAALVEQMDAATVALNDQAQKLIHIVKVFKTA